MSKIQLTKLKIVEDFFGFLPPDELIIVEQLRDIIFEEIPDSNEKLAYNVPFYYRHSRICFVWPASIPWGGLHSGVALGFCKGHLLSDEINYLEKRDRKEIRSKTFTSTEQINRGLIRSYLLEAKLIDEQL
ncbi:MAG: DUF1801 domain-containing protein [Bacteroidetes bacterium]|jgi:hypothetical protein|nr:DUF1801 domain-containing protein [Bacteroidota bacterium]